MTQLITKLLGNSARSAIVRGGLAMATMGVLPSAAMADRWDHHDRDHDHGSVEIDVRNGYGYSRPQYVNREERVWVEPVYRTVYDHVWVPAVTNTVTDHVWVPDRYETRDVVRWEHGHRRTVREEVLVDPGHFEDRCHDVVVSAAHFEDVQRQELLSPGHWETRITRVAVAPRPEPGFRFDLRLPVKW